MVSGSTASALLTLSDPRPPPSRLLLTDAQEEKRKAMFNEVVSNLANVCFDKCVTTPGR